MKKPILVVMAAGIGSRFGGLKQMTAFGPHGESLIDYSLYDAIQAGFERVIFIVNEKIKDDFRKIVGCHVENRMEVRYALQELDKLPAGLTVPTDRVKPWGTAHAVLCCGDMIDAPFCALNGDDMYGRDAMKEMYGFLSASPAPYSYTMVGYLLKNTLSENGSVSRGECHVDEAGFLSSVVERTRIIPTMDGPMFTLDQNTYTRLSEDTVVSMNLWGFTPDFMAELNARFPDFYRQAMEKNPLKGEYFLPSVVQQLLSEGKATVRVLKSEDKWYGVTNAADKEPVSAAIQRMTLAGIYPDGLWK